MLSQVSNQRLGHDGIKRKLFKKILSRAPTRMIEICLNKILSWVDGTKNGV